MNLRQWPNVTSLMKTITSNHVIKKAPTFSDEDMNKIFECLCQEATAKGYPVNRARLRLIGIAIAYFGLCRGQDLMNLNKKYIVQGDSGKYSVMYKPEVDPNTLIGGGNLTVKKRKHTVKPFQFDLPEWITPYMTAYVNFLCDKKDKNKRFVWNPFLQSTEMTKVYTQNVGKNNIVEWGSIGQRFC